jgi:hypothetical protein
MSNIQNPRIGYGFNQPLNLLAFAPILAKRDPTNKDKATYGTIWCNTSSGNVFILSDIGTGPNNYVWSGLTGVVDISSLTVSPGPISLTGTTNINTSGGSTTSIGNASSLTVITGDTTIGGGLIDINTTSDDNTTIGNVFGGDLTLLGDTIDIGSSSSTTINIVSPTLDINSTPNTGATLIGNTTGGTVVTGQLAVTTGSISLLTAGTSFALPGPVNIRSGSGAPAGGIAFNVGDLYINTSASTASTRLYIATAVGTWTTFTANA